MVYGQCTLLQDYYLLFRDAEGTAMEWNKIVFRKGNTRALVFGDQTNRKIITL